MFSHRKKLFVVFSDPHRGMGPSNMIRKEAMPAIRSATNVYPQSVEIMH